MKEILNTCQLFEGLPERDVDSMAALASHRTLNKGEYLFLLGDPADRMYVVLQGEIETCMPLSLQGSLKDVVVEHMGPGSALGWSAFVPPHRFTLSARAAGACEVAAFPRAALEQLFQSDARLGMGFLEKITALVSRRLSAVRALWARELQRAVDGGRLRSTPSTPVQ